MTILTPILEFEWLINLANKFAAKVNFGWLKGTDWAATSEVDSDMIGGTRATNLNYNGINVYGDEVSTGIKEVAVALEALGHITRRRECFSTKRCCE